MSRVFWDLVAGAGLCGVLLGLVYWNLGVVFAGGILLGFALWRSP